MKGKNVAQPQQGSEGLRSEKWVMNTRRAEQHV